MKQLVYHTALKQGSAEIHAEPRDRVETSVGLAFVHDIRKGLPAAFEACDVLYADPPWSAGFDVFERRAGQPPGANYHDLLTAIRNIVLCEKRLTILVIGHHALKYLPVPDYRIQTRLNGKLATAAAYHGQIPWFSDTVNLIHWLADRYNCLGDFCCGYGYAGRIFQQHGKRWIMSDYNARCIGYIAETFQ